MLETRGLTVHLVNARHVRNLPGRTSDVSDAEWLRDLHSVGLLRGSFRPTAAIVTLRTYLRHRHTLVELAATQVQRMQKALVQMNLQLPFVISDITGRTGLRIIRAIVAGEHDPAQLATFRDRRCRATSAEIAAALTGHYRPELLFALQQNLERDDACERQIEACDRAIEAHVRELTATMTPPGPLPAARASRQRVGLEIALRASDSPSRGDWQLDRDLGNASASARSSDRPGPSLHHWRRPAAFVPARTRGRVPRCSRPENRQLAFQIRAIPERDVVEEFSTDGANQALHVGM